MKPEKYLLRHVSIDGHHKYKQQHSWDYTANVNTAQCALYTFVVCFELCCCFREIYTIRIRLQRRCVAPIHSTSHCAEIMHRRFKNRRVDQYYLTTKNQITTFHPKYRMRKIFTILVIFAVYCVKLGDDNLVRQEDLFMLARETFTEFGTANIMTPILRRKDQWHQLFSIDSARNFAVRFPDRSSIGV